MPGWTRIAGVVVAAGVLTTLTACGKSSTAPEPRLDLTGTWSGVYGPPGSGTALRMTWEATHTANTVSGIATLVKPGVGVQARGAFTGTVNGDRIFLSYFVPTDSIPGFARCSIVGMGNATATTSNIAGQLSVMFSSCVGTGLEAPATNDLMLTK